QEDEGPNAVSQLARKMQGASAKSWNRFSSLFNKEDEHQLLEETECPPAADPLAAKPEEPPRPTRRSGFWDSFATNFAAKKQAEAAAAAAAAADEGVAESGEEGVTQAAGEEQQVGPAEETEAGSSSSNNSFSKYVTLGGSGEDASFKWNFVTSKLAELKTKGMVNKTN
uniref:Testis development-related protein-like n=1 Tax=Poecilia reticulata TaxID=8081 RepID=A0A3P9Q3L2_POERE